MGFYAVIRSIDEMEDYLKEVREAVSNRIKIAKKEI